jgi:glycosyltransferase involved in cell wall biosynthesis
MKVSVLMPTYNHELFIEQAIESFLQQKCNFDCELLIGDDKSKDNTLQIAQSYSNKYPEKIKLIEQPENIGLVRNYKSLIDIAKGEYLAVLESDDYWTDEYKLQTQVDYLDNNPDCGISFTRWERLSNNKLSLQPDESRKHSKYKNSLYESFLLWKNKVRATTVCFRKDLFDKYCNLDDYIAEGFQTIDYPVFVSIIRHSNIHYLAYSTAVYRILKTSISHNHSWQKALQYQDGISEMRAYVISKYGKGKLSDFEIANREVYLKFRLSISYGKYLLSLKYLFYETLNKHFSIIHLKLRIRIKDIRDKIKAIRMYSWFATKQYTNNKIVLHLVDGKYSHGGFCDRFKGIVSMFCYAQANGLPFRIDYNYPFQLSDYLIPNEYNWVAQENEISRKYADVKYLCLVRDPSAHRLICLDTNKQIHCHANRDIVEQINTNYQTNYNWGIEFNKLFKPNEKLNELIQMHKTRMNNSYISAQFRFINLLGDFKDNTNKTLSDSEKETLIRENLKALAELKQKYPNKTIFIASDSSVFIERASAIEGIYSLQGKVVHIDYIEGESFNVYLRVFLDFYLISESECVFAIGTDLMYKTEFPMYAAKVNNVPFERIVIPSELNS